MGREKVILAYSGGLDTSVAVKWINEKYNMDVVTYTCDLGQGRDLKKIEEKAKTTGAIETVVEDMRNMFVDIFVWPSLMAGTMYEGKYPLATALGRPLIAHRMVQAAKDYEATAVAHGCTGKRKRSGSLRCFLSDAGSSPEDHRTGERMEIHQNRRTEIRR